MRTSIVVFCALFLPSLSFAATMYHWTDDQGIMHFTDNAQLVPSGRLEEAAREIPDPLVDPPAALSGKISGSALWNAQCKKCHFFGQGVQSVNSRPVSSWMQNGETGTLLELTDLKISLEKVLSRRHINFFTKELGEDEILAIGEYMLEAEGKLKR